MAIGPMSEIPGITKGEPSMARHFIFLILGLAVSAHPARAAGKVTLESLLRQMTDLSLLAEFPDPPYVTRQFSSYDRASEAPGHESWFANDDHGFMLYDGVVKEKTPYFMTGDKTAEGSFAAGTKVGIAPNHRPQGEYVWVYATGPDGRAIEGHIPQGWIPKSAIDLDKQGHVLAEMEGPGCLVRIWSPNPQDAGNIRIYLDGATQPVIEAPMEALLAGNWSIAMPGMPGEQWLPFREPVACERSRGWNLYFPIPYAKHCKICTDKQDIYYHVDYRSYPKGTEVETFEVSMLSKMGKQLREMPAIEHPARKAEEVLFFKNQISSEHEANLKSGEKLRLPVSFEGPGAVLGLSANIPKSNETEALRSLVLLGTFDAAARPQIWCPLGDFFASSPGVNLYESLPFKVSRNEPMKEGHFQCWWPMPFQKSAVFEIHNLSQRDLKAGLRIDTTKCPWTDRSMHFHAKWRTEKLKTRPFRDWTYCDIKGQGVFVGDMLSVMNPVAAWWGEGDEKIFVDGEKFPSWFGTGTEDYYGYGWSDPKPFQHAYHNQTRCDGPANKGHTSVNRFHILDNIPFQKSFRFDMEFWHWTPNIEVSYAATSYWYARPGATDDFKEVDAKVLQDIPQPPPPMKVAGAIEGETMRILAKSSDFEIGPQDMGVFSDSQWSGDSQLWVRPTKQGEWIDMELPVAGDGRYHVIVYLTKAQDYGVIQFHLNGKPLGKPIDCFEPDQVVRTGAIDLGEVDLKKGTATMRVEVVGTNERSVGLRYMWGLDCVVLKRQSSIDR
jgi:hypothetical protein